MLRITLLLALLFPSTAFSQAVWNGRQYNSRVCSNPNCGMCNSIQTQLQPNRQTWSPQPTPARPVAQVVQSATQSVATTTRAVTRMVAQQVKRCNGRQCWYETIMVPVTTYEAVPVQPVTAPTPQPVAAPSAPNLLTNTTLVPTPPEIVQEMIAALDLNPTSKFFDLGCGDGRFLIEAAKNHACYSIGIELNPQTAAIARKHAQNEFVSELVTIFSGDVRNYDLYEADTVSMYLYPQLMETIIPRLKKGTRIVSYQHDIPGVSSESVSIPLNGETHIFFIGVKQ